MNRIEVDIEKELQEGRLKAYRDALTLRNEVVSAEAKLDAAILRLQEAKAELQPSRLWAQANLDEVENSIKQAEARDQADVDARIKEAEAQAEARVQIRIKEAVAEALRAAAESAREAH